MEFIPSWESRPSCGCRSALKCRSHRLLSLRDAGGGGANGWASPQGQEPVSDGFDPSWESRPSCGHRSALKCLSHRLLSLRDAGQRVGVPAGTGACQRWILIRRERAGPVAGIDRVVTRRDNTVSIAQSIHIRSGKVPFAKLVME